MIPAHSASLSPLRPHRLTFGVVSCSGRSRRSSVRSGGNSTACALARHQERDASAPPRSRTFRARRMSRRAPARRQAAAMAGTLRLSNSLRTQQPGEKASRQQHDSRTWALPGRQMSRPQAPALAKTMTPSPQRQRLHTQVSWTQHQHEAGPPFGAFISTSIAAAETPSSRRPARAPSVCPAVGHDAHSRSPAEPL